MKKSKISFFTKGDVILTTPERGFFGIAIVLSEREKTTEQFAGCHIGIIDILCKSEIKFEDLNFDNLNILDFDRTYNLQNKEIFYKKETLIGVYNTKNKTNFKIIGTIDPKIIYDGPLPFEPWYDLEVKWPLYGDSDEYLGREAYLTFIKNQE